MTEAINCFLQPYEELRVIESTWTPESPWLQHYTFSQGALSTLLISLACWRKFDRCHRLKHLKGFTLRGERKDIFVSAVVNGVPSSASWVGEHDKIATKTSFLLLSLFDSHACYSWRMNFRYESVFSTPHSRIRFMRLNYCILTPPDA